MDNTMWGLKKPDVLVLRKLHCKDWVRKRERVKDTFVKVLMKQLLFIWSLVSGTWCNLFLHNLLINKLVFKIMFLLINVWSCILKRTEKSLANWSSYVHGFLDVSELNCWFIGFPFLFHYNTPNLKYTVI